MDGVESYLHRDQLNSVVLITDAAGAKAREETFLPFGLSAAEDVALPAVAEDAKGFIGERYDSDAGLQYLNARYYDPELGLFLQPDWFEVTQAGVGTNRYSYSFNDPVNGRDPLGNATCGTSIGGNDCSATLQASETARDELGQSIALAQKSIERLESNENTGLFSGVWGFKRRFEASYGENSFNTENLSSFVDMAQIVSDGIGPTGAGVALEHYGLAEAAFRQQFPDAANEDIDALMSQLFGEKRFRNPDGSTTSYTGRATNAAGWAAPGGGSIALDNGFQMHQRGSRVIVHEGAHAFLSLRDHHKLAGNGYGRVGRNAAREAGVAWENADSFACVVSGC